MEILFNDNPLTTLPELSLAQLSKNEQLKICKLYPIELYLSSELIAPPSKALLSLNEEL